LVLQALENTLDKKYFLGRHGLQNKTIEEATFTGVDLRVPAGKEEDGKRGFAC